MEGLTETANISYTWFNCGCREWGIAPGDVKGVKEQPPKTVKDHECAKITVFRDERGFRRYFMRKTLTKE